eukprot:jgi/Undpi1/8068/HiC_scaffold_24.g10540.m1
MKKTYIVLASILSTTVFNGSTSASAQSLFGGVPSVVRSCHKFASRDWTAPDTASFLRSIVCEDPTQDPKDENHGEKAELGPTIKASMAAYHARLNPAPGSISSPTIHDISTSSPLPSSYPSPPSVESGDDETLGGFFVLTRYSDSTGGRSLPPPTEIDCAFTGTTDIDEDDSQLDHANTNSHQDHTDIPDAHGFSTGPSPDANHVNTDGQITPSRKRRTFVIGLNGLNPSPRTSPYRGIFSPNPYPNEATFTLAFNPRGHSPGPLPDGPYSVTKPCLPYDNSFFSITRFLITWLLWRPSIHPRPSDPLFKPIRDSSPSPYRWTAPPEPTRRTYYICLNGRRPGVSPSTRPSPSPSSNSSPSPAGHSLSPTLPASLPLGLGPKTSLNVGEQLDGKLRSRTGKSMIWPASNGCVIFARLLGKSSAVAPSDDCRRVHSTLLLASNGGKLKRILQARKELQQQMRDGPSKVIAGGTGGSMGWLPWRRRDHQDVELARVHLGRVVITLDNRGRLVSRESGCFGVLSK